MLVVPLAGQGEGTGHFVRCVALCRLFKGEASLHTMERSPRLSPPEDVPFVVSPQEEAPWDLVVLDRKSTTKKDYRCASAWGPVLLWDDRGSARKEASLVVDSLSLPSRGEEPNCVVSPLLVSPTRRKRSTEQVGRVLISFGGEDPAGLTAKLVRFLSQKRIVSPHQMTVVEGTLFLGEVGSHEVEVWRDVPSLSERLCEFDLVLTSFGLTAFEAAAANVPVILFNPTRYHRRLSRKAGFCEIGVKTISKRRLTRYLESIENGRCDLLAPPRREQERSLSILVKETKIRGYTCPLCASQERRSLERFLDRTYFRCLCCGMIYLSSVVVAKKGERYERGYFFEQYAQQYGKTYLEDFGTIFRMGQKRMKRILALSKKLKPPITLLDVGCAYGPFLEAAEERGVMACGLDISEEAVAYVEGTLRIPVVCQSFTQEETLEIAGRLQYDVVTMWYVIEHFPQLGATLSKLNALLPKGGLLALAVPSAEGISFRVNTRAFLEASPKDHFTVWDPRKARGYLKRYGFKLCRKRITGHHPERFPWVKGRCLRLKGGLATMISHLWGRGDTFEMYARKVRDL